MKQSDVNHLRRLLGWIRCEIGQAPAELQQTMIEVADGLGHPEISQEAKARMVETYRRAEAVPLYVRAAVKALERTLAARGREPGVEPACATAETRASIGFDPGADAGREPMDRPAPGQGGEAATHRTMSLGEILAEYRKGCGNTVGTGPEHCPECVAAFVLALEALDTRQQCAPMAGEAKPVAWRAVWTEPTPGSTAWRDAHEVSPPDADELSARGCSLEVAYAAPQASQAVPDRGSKVINDACWKFVEAMPHQLPGPIWNDLKPALYAAVCHVLSAQPANEPAISRPAIATDTRQAGGSAHSASGSVDALRDQRLEGVAVQRPENPLDTAANRVARRDTPPAPPTLRRNDVGGAGADRRDLPAAPAQQLQKALADLVAECTRADAQVARELQRTFIYPNVLAGARRVLAASLQADREAAGEAQNCRSTDNPQAMQEGQP